MKLNIFLCLLLTGLFVAAQKPIPPQERKVVLQMDNTSYNAVMTALAHTANFLDNGTYRNNYDSVKLAINDLVSVYNYLKALKAQSDTAGMNSSDTTKHKP